MKEGIKQQRFEAYKKELGLDEKKLELFITEWKTMRNKLKKIKKSEEKKKLRQDFRSTVTAKFGDEVLGKMQKVNKALRKSK